MATKGVKELTKTVSLGSGLYGTPEPQIKLQFPEGTCYRTIGAELYKLAAEIEMATPASEHWNVETQRDYAGGRVYLELEDATDAERGMAVLRKVAGQKGRE